MTIATDAAPDTNDSNESTRPWRKMFLGAGVLAILAVVAVAWWLGLHTPEPEAVSLAASVQAVEAELQAADAIEAGEEADQTEDTSAQETATVEPDALAWIHRLVLGAGGSRPPERAPRVGFC